MELAKLQMAYLEKVYNDDTAGQAKMIDTIFYWLDKQIALRTLDEANMLGMVEPPKIVQLTDAERVAWVEMESLLLMAVSENHNESIETIEREMRKWIDDICDKAAQRIQNEHLNPKMKVIMKPDRDNRLN